MTSPGAFRDLGLDTTQFAALLLLFKVNRATLTGVGRTRSCGQDCAGTNTRKWLPHAGGRCVFV